ncbi:AraC family transcriptional regulator [Shouchella shacheensis]|uniref:AraC family transcriptional regulator n=1 Tax=Shouchella shacheensis TaxID=1649580 RepID=UPI00074028B4|nr:helix-turn-helix domain-containing protein [Shouchella shacheensis]
MLSKAELENRLFALSEEERGWKEQDRSARNEESEHETISVRNEQICLFDEGLFYKNEKLSIRKHIRYSIVPKHVHSYIELIYVYRGQCQQIIKDELITLHEGDFCILDTRVPHKVLQTTEEDLIINVLLRESYFTYAFMNRLNKQGVISQFLVSIMYEQHDRDSFLVFRALENQHLPVLMTNLLSEYFDKGAYSDSILEGYMFLIFTELLRVYEYDWKRKEQSLTKYPIIIDVLSYIEEHYRHCSLKEAAAHFSFSPSYLSTLIKKRTSSTFSELVKMERMRKVRELLTNTELTVDEISIEVGYTNVTFFYKVFKKEFHMTPHEFRFRNQSFVKRR